MKLRRRAEPLVMGFQIAPMVDVLLVLLCFFILTWNFARKESELSVTVPTAENAKDPKVEVNLDARLKGSPSHGQAWQWEDGRGIG